MDVDVFKQRFLPFHPKLYRIAYALLDNKADAEDILQDAYCKLWNKRDELGDIQNPEAFSITLVKNLCLDFLRSPKASRRDNEEALETVLLTTDSSPEKAGDTLLDWWNGGGYPAYTGTDRAAPREPEAGNPPAWY